MSGPDPEPTGRDARAAFRQFVRDNHPDRGGDPAEFRAGLVRFGRAMAPHRRRPDRDYRSPITVHHRRKGLGVFVDAAVLRWRRHRRPPRVR